MLGMVLSGLDKLCYAFNHTITLNNVIQNRFATVTSSHPISWIGENMSMLSPIFVVAIASIIIILIYLYKTSELINKKKLSWMLIIVLLLFIIANALTILKNRPPEIKFRLALFPIQSDSTLTQSNWVGDALWSMISQQLQRSVADQAIISPVEWTRSIIITADSIQNLNYLRKLSQQMKAEYFLIGKLSVNDSFQLLTYQMIQANTEKSVITGSFELASEKLPELSRKISGEILNFFNSNINRYEGTITYVFSDAYQHYLNGRNFYHQKKYPLALKLAKQVIETDSSFAETFLLAGKSSFMIGLEKKNKGESPIEEFEQARKWLSHALELDSLTDEAYAFLGEYYIYQERWSLAEQMLSKAYHFNPNNPRLYLTLSRIHKFRYQKLGFKNEEQLFKRAIFVNPCYEDAYLILADYYLFENEREKAIRVLEQILQINPNSVPVLMALGKIYLVRNEILKIIEVFNRVIELEPDNADAYYNIGILYYNSKDFDIAEKLFLRAIAIDNHLNAHLYLAYLYENKGDYDKAIKYLRKRIHYRKGLDDEFAEEARKHLFKLLNRDSTATDTI